MAIVAIAFTPAPVTDSRNLRHVRQDDPRQIYYAAIELAFRTYRRWLPEARILLVSDAEPPKSTRNQLDDVEAEWLEAPFDSRTPVPLGPTFQSSLYTIDAINALVQAATTDDEPLLLLDPDCLAVRPLAALAARATQRIGAYPLNFAPEYVSNGLSGTQAAVLHTKLNPQLHGVPPYFGGEYYGFTRNLMLPIQERIRGALQLSVALAREGQPRFSTEEHIMNYALRGVDVDVVDDSVRRIWTAPTHRTVTGDEGSLTLWHLPSEKDRGFPRALQAARERESWFYSDESTFRRHMGKLLGLGRRPPSRFVYDTVAREARGIQSRWRNHR